MDGRRMHWARDTADHNYIVHGILRDYGATSLLPLWPTAMHFGPALSPRMPMNMRPHLKPRRYSYRATGECTSRSVAKICRTEQTNPRSESKVIKSPVPVGRGFHPATQTHGRELARSFGGIQYRGETSEAVCKLGLEGIVSKKQGSPYRSGNSKSWRDEVPYQVSGGSTFSRKIIRCVSASALVNSGDAWIPLLHPDDQE
jgi:hypothetical protein